MLDFKIRRAEPGDAEQLRDLFAHPGTYGGTLQLPHPSVELWRERLQAPDPNRYSLVALVDEVIVASAGLHVQPAVRRRHAADIGIGVADAFVGKGIGTALIRELVRMADDWLHLLRLELTVFADNEPAIALYRKFGFEVEGRFRAYALRGGELVDTLAMARLHPNPPRLPS